MRHLLITRPAPRPRHLRRAIARAVGRALAPGLMLGVAGCSETNPPVPVETNSDAGHLANGDAGADAALPDGSAAPDSAAADAARDGSNTPDGHLWDGGVDGGAFFSGFLPFPCNDKDAWDPVAGIVPAAPFDYLGLFSGPAGNALTSSGQACLTAVEKATCMAAFDSARKGGQVTISCNPAGCTNFFVVTRGDQVRSLADSAALLTFLGPVDRPADAALLAHFADQYGFQCGDASRSGYRTVAGGFELAAIRRISDCPVKYASFVIHVSAQGQIEVRREGPAPTGYGGGGCIGRRPAGLLAEACEPPRWTLSTLLADSAGLEAASVPAFHELARDLRRLGAPASLIAEALRSAEDEVRHAQMVGRLATRSGVRPVEPEVLPSASRDLRTLALENAVEGCVRETFGAAVAAYQAQTAADDQIAAVMGALADDEARHAQLAWEIAAWVAPRLDPETRTELRRLQREAVQALRRELTVEHAPEVYTDAGWPVPARALAMIDELDAQLWAATA